MFERSLNVEHSPLARSMNQFSQSRKTQPLLFNSLETFDSN